jgi:hypothetical protein
VLGSSAGLGRGSAPPRECIKQTVKHEKKIMVWGCFAGHGVGQLHRINGIMDKHVYLNILETVAKPSCEELFPADDEGDHDYMFQEDNDPKHTSKLCKRWKGRHMNLLNTEESWFICLAFHLLHSLEVCFGSSRSGSKIRSVTTRMSSFDC